MNSYSICYLTNLNLNNPCYKLHRNVFSFIFRDESAGERFCLGSLDNNSDYEIVQLEERREDLDPLVIVDFDNISQTHIDSIKQTINDTECVKDDFSYGTNKWDNQINLVMLQSNEPRVLFIKNMKVKCIKIRKDGKGLFIEGY